MATAEGKMKMEYDEKTITSMRVKLNSGSYSKSWMKKHIRGLISEVERLRKQDTPNKNLTEKTRFFI